MEWLESVGVRPRQAFQPTELCPKSTIRRLPRPTRPSGGLPGFRVTGQLLDIDQSIPAILPSPNGLNVLSVVPSGQT